jgi:diadenosine tetraphosphate (Ap4A) HIT family hydrolase
MVDIRWPEDWAERKAGRDCPFCTEESVDANPYGIRIFTGQVSDAYLQRRAPLPGFTIVVWRGRHVAEPTELSDDEACVYWRELLHVTRALEAEFHPAQVNYLTLGNQIPHLHTNVVLRFLDDSAPGKPIDLDQGAPIPDATLQTRVSALRSRLEQ